MPSYKLTPEADNDLENIFAYGVDTFGVEKAVIYLLALEHRFQEIAENPTHYREVKEIRKGYRRSVCGVHSIYYRVIGDIVEIMAILGRQDYEKRLF